jgi:hypothetical protein
MMTKALKLTVDMATAQNIEEMARRENRSLANAAVTLMKEALWERQKRQQREHATA